MWKGRELLIRLRKRHCRRGTCKCPEAASASLPAELSQSRSFVHGDMIGLVALNFILGLVLSRVVCMALVIRVLRMDFDNPASDMPSLGIPSDVITDLETLYHILLQHELAQHVHGPITIKISPR